MRLYDDYLRWLYRGGRPSWFARVQNRLSAVAFAAGIMPGRLAELQVRGRRTGRVIGFPVVIADYEGERYLVSMLGNDVNWVRNLRAADGRAVLRHGRRERVRLEEVGPPDRAPVLRRYLQLAPGARPHIPVDRKAPLADFERASPGYPVFRILTDPASLPRPAPGGPGRPQAVRAAWRRCIGIDDELPGREAVAVTEERAQAERFAELFRAVYLTFHRRDRPRGELPGASRAVLEHLALAGPLTIGEAAAHLRRAQSVISEIVTHLERDGLLEREADPGDRRRTLIWLTQGGQEALRRDRDVLGIDLLARAMARLPPGQADALNAAMRTLIEHAQSDGVRPNGGDTHDHDASL